MLSPAANEVALVPMLGLGDSQPGGGQGGGGLWPASHRQWPKVAMSLGLGSSKIEGENPRKLDG